MSNELAHHGIKDQKWGLRRFQNPDGSLTPEGRKRYGVGEARNGSTADGQTSSGPGSGRNTSATKNLKKWSRKSHTLSDDELLSRINRLEKEKRYSDLVKEQKEKETSVAKKMLGHAAERLAEQSLNKLVDKIVDKVFGEKDNFDISKYKDADVYTLDAKTIKKVADWYTKAGIITWRGFPESIPLIV